MQTSRPRKRRWLYQILVIFLFAAFVATMQLDVWASSVQYVSGSYNLTLSNYAGVSEYTIDYRYPATVNVGQTFNVTVTVLVDELTELKLYVYDWGVVSTLNSPAGPPVSDQMTINNAYHYLYAGSHWGPVNVSIPITSGNFSVTSGKSYVSSVDLEWIADVQYDRPYNWHFYESNVTDLGNVTLLNQAQSGASNIFLHTYLEVGGVIFGVVATLIFGWILINKPVRQKLRPLPSFA